MRSTAILLSVLLGQPFAALATIAFVPIDITTATGSSATQSTGFNGDTFPANLALNGNTGDFTHTAVGDLNPAWTGDLGRDESFNSILVHNRDSCCAERLSDITVRVQDAGGTEVFSSGVLNPNNVLASPALLEVPVGQTVTGRRIIVARDGASTVGSAAGGMGVLSLGEVQIGELRDVDFPLGTSLTRAGIVAMTVAQAPTSAAPPGGGFPFNGVDGNLGNFTHTNANATVNHTWQVDFGEEMRLQRVTLRNRTNCCGERLRDITVSLLDGTGTVVFASEVLNPENVLGFSGTNQPGLEVDFESLNGGNPVAAQTLVVTRTPAASGISADDQSVLSLGEVEVTGGSGGVAVPFAITGFVAGPGEAMVTLTWNSRPGKLYAVDRASGLQDWEEVTDSVPSGGASTSAMISGPAPTLGAEYYRVREVP